MRMDQAKLLWIVTDLLGSAPSSFRKMPRLVEKKLRNRGHWLMPDITTTLVEANVINQTAAHTSGSSRRRVAVSLILLALFATITYGATDFNNASPIGVNLQQVSYWTSEQPFLNAFKTAGGWTPHTETIWDTKEGEFLDLDSSGWPKSLSTKHELGPQKLTSVGVLLFRGMPETENGFYPAGQYIVLYDGEGHLTYRGDARLVTARPGRDVINVQKTSQGGIEIRLEATNPGNYLRNIRVVKAEYEKALLAGQVFNPRFLESIRRYRALRFMQWFNTNATTEASWSQRPLVSDAFWGTDKGVPFEVALELANAISADAWLTIPIAADDNYVSELAKLVKSQLGSSQRAYVELSNEVWNGTYPANAYSVQRGEAIFPRAPNKHYAGWEWYGMRVAQIADIWYQLYGDGFNARVSVVMSGQASYPTVLEQELTTPDWVGANNGPAVNHHISAVAIAPYFGGLPSPECLEKWVAQPDGGLGSFFQSLYQQTDPSVPIGGYVGSLAPLVRDNQSIAKRFKIALLAYEGGESFEGFPRYQEESPVLKLLIDASRDRRMADAYSEYLSVWKANGGTLFMQFLDTYRPGKYGEWGALESPMQNMSPLNDAPPKWRAIQEFIATQPCWWTGCSATKTD